MPYILYSPCHCLRTSPTTPQLTASATTSRTEGKKSTKHLKNKDYWWRGKEPRAGLGAPEPKARLGAPRRGSSLRTQPRARPADLPGEAVRAQPGPAREDAGRQAAGPQEVAAGLQEVAAGPQEAAVAAARAGSSVCRRAAWAGRQAGTQAAVAVAAPPAAPQPAEGWWLPACWARWAGRAAPGKPRWCGAG